MCIRDRVKPGQTAHDAEYENHHKYQESLNFREPHGHGDDHGHADDHDGEEKDKNSH